MVLRGAPLRRVDEHARRDRRHVVQRLAHRGERRPQEGGCLHVVETDNRKVFGDAQPVLPGGLINAHRLQVAAGEDRGGAVRILQQRHRLRIAAFGREIAFRHQFGVQRDALLGERRRVAAEPCARTHHLFGAGDDADARVAQREQVACREHAAGPVVRLHGEVIVRWFARRVEDDVGDAIGL